MNKTKTLLQAFFFIALLSFMVACSGGFGSLAKGELVEVEDFRKMQNDKASDSKRIMLKAHVAPFKTLVVTGEKAKVQFNTKEGEAVVDLSLLRKGKNAFRLPAEYNPEDIKVIDNAGGEHLCGEQVCISFTMKLKGDNPFAGVTGLAAAAYSWTYEDVRIDAVE